MDWLDLLAVQGTLKSLLQLHSSKASILHTRKQYFSALIIQEPSASLLGTTPISTSLVAQLVKHLPTMWETWVQPLGWEDPLKEGTDTHSSILAWRIP